MFLSPGFLASSVVGLRNPMPLYSVNDFNISGSKAWVTFNTDGSASYTTSGGTGPAPDWLTRIVAAAGAGFWVQATVTAGNALTQGGTTAVRLDLARSFGFALITGSVNKSAAVRFDFYADAGGTQGAFLGSTTANIAADSDPN